MWSSDGLRLIYVTYDRRRNVSVVMRRAADGSGEAETLSEIDGQAYIDDISRDGSTLSISANRSTAGGRFAVFILAVQKGARAVLFESSTTGDVQISSLSPDGKWIAYSTNQSGRVEIFVQPFPSGGNRSKVTKVGGYEPRWASDSRTLYYSQADKLMAVPVEPGTAFSPGKTQELFSGMVPAVTDSGKTYAVDRASGRFLMLRPVQEGAGPPEVRMILNWFAELRALKLGN